MFKRWASFSAPLMALVCVLGVALAPAFADERPEARLSLNEALKMALENNLDLVSAGMSPQLSELEVESQSAAWDPTISAGTSRNESESELSSLFSTTTSTSDRANVSISQPLKFGGQVDLDFSGGRFDQSGPLIISPSNYGSTLDLRFSMPLLRGRGKEFVTERLQLARGNLEVSHETFRLEVHRVMENTEGAYWNLLAAQAGLRIANLSLERAQDLLELNRKKVEVGTLAPIEITTAEAEVASQEEGVIRRENELEDAEDALRQLLAVTWGDPMWESRLVLTDIPSFDPVAVDLEETLEVALQHRPEMFNAQQSVRNLQLSETVARKRTRPDLSLNANYTPTGNNFESTQLAGFDGILNTPDDIVLNDVVGKLHESVKEVFDFDNYSWSVGLNFSHTLGNRQAKAGYATARINRERAEVDLDRQIQSIRVEVRGAVRAVTSGHKRVEAARVNVELQRENLEAEQKKFDNGMSTSFQVLEFQENLASAELSEIQARLDYIKAITSLERVQGTLLEARGLSI